MVTIGWRIRRIGQAVFTVWAVLTLSFVLIRVMPGSAMGAMMVRFEQMGMDPARARDLVEARLSLRPDDPLPIAYAKYMYNSLQGDLGTSMVVNSGTPVVDILAQGLPWTLFVLSWGVFISFFVGIVVGALMAYWEGGKLDIGMTISAITLSSIPFYVLGILLLIFLGYRWGHFPIRGRQPTGVDPGLNYEYMKGIMHHAALPIISYFVATGVASLGMRGNAIRVLGEDYLRVARLRGLSDFTISTQYVSRNAVLPMYTALMIRIGHMFGGSIVLEEIYSYRGLGLILYEAYQARDYPLMMGGFVILTTAIVTALFIADMTYSWIDPRAGGRKGESY